ncbi:MAG: hypothetical protein V1918_04800, partial [Planctomycetota bacterium]
MRTFLEGRVGLSDFLASRPEIATYADSVLILTAVLSACASRRWPGTGMDKKRFIELLVRHSPEEFHTSWVSLPALINAGLIAEKDTAYGKPGQSFRIFCGSEIDLSFKEAEKQYPGVLAKQLREYSYACMIYEWLRCGYAHEYCPHDEITPYPSSHRSARVSYICRGGAD